MKTKKVLLFVMALAGLTLAFGQAADTNPPSSPLTLLSVTAATNQPAPTSSSPAVVATSNAPAGETSVVPHLVLGPIPQSVFVPIQGGDPFFPNSTRRVAASATNEPGLTNLAATALAAANATATNQPTTGAVAVAVAPTNAAPSIASMISTNAPTASAVSTNPPAVTIVGAVPTNLPPAAAVVITTNVTPATAVASNAPPAVVATAPAPAQPSAPTNVNAAVSVASAVSTNLPTASAISTNQPAATVASAAPTNSPPAAAVVITTNVTPATAVASKAVAAVALTPAPATPPPVLSITTNVVSAPDLPATTSTAQASRFADTVQTNRITVDARWKTSLGDGEYLETRTIEAATPGAKQATPEVPSVADLVNALKEAHVAKGQAASTPKTAGVSAHPTHASQDDGAHVANAQPGVPVLKNPTILQDGRLVELQGEWLYTKDGTPVFVPETPVEPDEMIADTEEEASPAEGTGGNKHPSSEDGVLPLVRERPFVILTTPGGGNVPPARLHVSGPGMHVVHPQGYNRGGYYQGDGYYGGSRGYSGFSSYNYGGVRYVRGPTGALYQTGNVPMSMKPMYRQHPVTGAWYQVGNRQWR